MYHFRSAPNYNFMENQVWRMKFPLTLLLQWSFWSGSSSACLGQSEESIVIESFQKEFYQMCQFIENGEMGGKRFEKLKWFILYRMLSYSFPITSYTTLVAFCSGILNQISSWHIVSLCSHRRFNNSFCSRDDAVVMKIPQFGTTQHSNKQGARRNGLNWKRKIKELATGLSRRIEFANIMLVNRECCDELPLPLWDFNEWKKSSPEMESWHEAPSKVVRYETRLKDAEWNTVRKPEVHLELDSSKWNARGKETFFLDLQNLLFRFAR